MGAADIVPGVSGGTMALVLGIYKQFIEAINNKVAEVMGYKEQEDEIQAPELSRIRDLAGL